MKSIISILCFLLFCAVELPIVQAACGKSSIITVLENDITGKDFCSTLLYPNPPTVVATTTLSFTYTDPPCKTKVVKITSGTVTVTKTKVTVEPSIKYFLYTSTVLVASGTHRTVNKRQANSTSPISTTTTTSANVASTNAVSANAAATTSSTSAPAAAAAAASVSANAQTSCSPTPSELCTCPIASISAACSYMVPPPEDITSTVYDDITINCTTKDYYTTTVGVTTITTTETDTAYPPLKTISKTGTLTRTVPAACAGPAYDAPKKNNIPDGAEFHYADYPYYGKDPVDCCVFCYDSEASPNCIASAFDGQFCSFLQQVNQTANGKTSPQCPLGVVNYNFKPNPSGVVYPGPCGF